MTRGEPSLPRWASACLFAGSLAFSALLIHGHPAIYWGDGHGRALLRDHLLIDRWLPLLQLVIFTVGKVTRSLLALRLVLSAIAASAVLAAARLGASLATRSAGLVFGVLLATNLLFAALAIVPYQEALFAGLVFAALTVWRPGVGARRVGALALLLNLACLTRYEGWILVAVLAADDLVSATQRDGFARGLRSGAVFAVRNGAAAIAWLIVLVVSRGTWRFSGAIDHPRAAVVPTVLEYARQCAWQVNSHALLAAAVVGVGVSLRRDLRRHAVIPGFVVCAIVFILLDQPYSSGNLRQTFLPVVFLLLYAAIGLDAATRVLVSRLSERGGRRARMALLAVTTGMLAWASASGAMAFVAASSDELRYAFEVGTWLAGLPPRDRERAHVALLDAADIDATAIALYAGIPAASFEAAHGSLPGGTTIVVRVSRGSTPLSAEARGVVALLEGGTLRASETRLAQSVVWMLPAGTEAETGGQP